MIEVERKEHESRCQCCIRPNTLGKGRGDLWRSPTPFGGSARSLFYYYYYYYHILSSLFLQ